MTQNTLALSSRSQPVLRELTPTDLPALLELQSTVEKWLGKENAHFIIPKTAQRFSEFLLPNGDNFAVGIEYGGRLVASALVEAPNPHDEKSNKASGLVQSVFVHPDHQGQGFMPELLHGVEVTAQKKQITYLTARVAKDNIGSVKGFVEKAAYATLGDDKRDTDGTPLTIVGKPVPPSHLCILQFVPRARNSAHPEVKALRA